MTKIGKIEKMFKSLDLVGWGDVLFGTRAPEYASKNFSPAESRAISAIASLKGKYSVGDSTARIVITDYSQWVAGKDSDGGCYSFSSVYYFDVIDLTRYENTSCDIDNRFPTEPVKTSFDKLFTELVKAFNEGFEVRLFFETLKVL